MNEQIEQGPGRQNGKHTPRPMMCRGVRGAITVTRDDETEILEATRELLQAVMAANGINPDHIASIYFSTTPDLVSTYPAYAARQLGWFDMALICGHEMAVPTGLSHCVRILIHWNTTHAADEIVHVYLRDAKSLRPDRSNIPPVRPRQISAVEAAVKFLSLTL